MVTIAEKKTWTITDKNGKYISTVEYNAAMTEQEVREDLIIYRHFDIAIQVSEA